jgi:hypothetical protein
MNLLLPDDVEMDVPIEYLAVKDSVFIPTLKATELRYIMRRVAKEIEITIEMQTVIEDGYLGLMVWRTK